MSGNESSPTREATRPDVSEGAETLWLNGGFVPADRAAISPFDRGFLYGDGIFETIRAEKGRVLYLRSHLARLAEALSFLRIRLDSTPDWETAIGGLLGKNGLRQATASVKILVTRGIVSALGLPETDRPTVCVTARAYDPPGRGVYEKGWKLCVCREGFSPPLARIKSLNYLYFLLARQAAADVGADEAVILDPRGHVTETAAGSLLARTGGKWWTPDSPFRLPGITLRAVSEMLNGSGHTVERRPAGPDDLFAAETVWVLNSMIGVMPVYRIEESPVPDPAVDEAARMRSALFEQG